MRRMPLFRVDIEQFGEVRPAWIASEAIALIIERDSETCTVYIVGSEDSGFIVREAAESLHNRIEWIRRDIQRQADPA